MNEDKSLGYTFKVNAESYFKKAFNKYPSGTINLAMTNTVYIFKASHAIDVRVIRYIMWIL